MNESVTAVECGQPLTEMDKTEEASEGTFPSYNANETEQKFKKMIESLDDKEESNSQQEKAVSKPYQEPKTEARKLMDFGFLLTSDWDDRQSRLKEEIGRLTRSNIEIMKDEILKNKFYANVELFGQLVKKTDLYQEPSFVELLKGMNFPHWKKKHFDVIWEQFEVVSIESGSDAQECIDKLKVFLQLMHGSLFLHSFIKQCEQKRQWNSHYIDILKFLLEKEASFFHQITGEEITFISFLKMCSSSPVEPVMPSILSLLEEILKSHLCCEKKNILNDIVKNVPRHIFIDYPRMKDLILKICHRMIQANRPLCDGLDSDGRTAFHNLMEKLLMDDLWQEMPEFVAGTDFLWRLLPRMLTEKNMHLEDKDGLAPSHWILFFTELLDLKNESSTLKKMNAKMFQHLANYPPHLQPGSISFGFTPDESFGRTWFKFVVSKVQSLTRSNLEQMAKELLKINDAKSYIFQRKPPIMSKLLERPDDLFNEQTFVQLLKALYPTCGRSTSIRKQILCGIIGELFKSVKIDSEAKKEVYMTKIKIYLSLEAEVSTMFLWTLINNCICDKDGNKHFVDVLTYLVRNGANPFESIKGSTSLPLFLMKFLTHPSEIPMASVLSFLEESVAVRDSTNNQSILNDIIKSIPSDILVSNSRQLSPIKRLLLEKCLEMIKNNFALCDEVDRDRRTAFHNLMEKLLIDGLWQEMPEFVAGTDIIWRLMSQIITKKNVHLRDKDGVTPYTWILLLRESTNFPVEQGMQNVSMRIQDIAKRFNVDDGALQELDDLREKQMEGMLGRLINFHPHMDEQLKISDDKEITSACIKIAEMKMMRLRYLMSKGCGKFLSQPTWIEKIKTFVENHIMIQNDRILAVFQVILEILLHECNAANVFAFVTKYINPASCKEFKTNQNFLFGVIKRFLEKGACPNTSVIYHVSLMMVTECKTYEDFLATVQMLEQLIGAYRKHGFTKPLKIYLNPLQDQWVVKEDLRKVSCAVIREAYGTLNNCMESGSVVNTLLSLGKFNGDGEEIANFFSNTPVASQTDAENQLSKWIEENGKYYREEEGQGALQQSQLQWYLIKTNINWLNRNVLHLAAIFCDDKEGLNSIPKEVVDKYINGRDLHGATPLHIAHLCGNQAAIMFLQGQNAEAVDYFGRTPESLSSPLCFGNSKKENSSAFSTLKKPSDTSIQECEEIQQNLKQFFEMMVSKDGLLNAKIEIIGSERDQMKMKKFEKIALLLSKKDKPSGKFACLKLHAHLVTKMTEVYRKGSILRCVSVRDEWVFIWEGNGSHKGRYINVDVVPAFMKYSPLKDNDRIKMLIDDAHWYEMMENMKWRYFWVSPDWSETFCKQERDILQNMSLGCRFGILVANVVLQDLDQTYNSCSWKKPPITSTLITNALLWLLAGQTPIGIEMEHGNVIQERYGALQKMKETVQMNPVDLKEFSELSEVEFNEYANEGRFWAEKIFETIQFMARKYRVTLDSFFGNDNNDLDIHELIDVLHACDRCLEYLFNEDKRTSSEVARNRLQEMMNKIQEGEERVPVSGLLQKREKELKS